jgi:hypothetical protein
MARASETLCKEVEVDRWGHRPGVVPPMPLASSAIRKLGLELDAAEREGTWGRLKAARAAFGEALAVRRRYLTWKFANRRSALREADVIRLRDRKCVTEDRIYLFEELGPDFHTSREWTYANYQFTLADFIFDVASVMYKRQRSARNVRDRADHRKGISYQQRSRRNEVHL